MQQNPNIEAIIAGLTTVFLAVIAFLSRPIVMQIVTFIISKFTSGKGKVGQEVVDNLLRAMLETQQKCERTEQELRAQIRSLEEKYNAQLVVNARLETELISLRRDMKKATDEHKQVGP